MYICISNFLRKQKGINFDNPSTYFWQTLWFLDVAVIDFVVAVVVCGQYGVQQLWSVAFIDQSMQTS